MAISRDPFYSPKQRLSRANDHIRRLHKRIETFFKKAPYSRVIELDTDGVTQLHKFKFTKRLPDSCVLSATEALEALRSTLDQTGYAATVAAGKVSPKKTQFPIGDDAAGLENLVRLQQTSQMKFLRFFYRSNRTKEGMTLFGPLEAVFTITSG
jgi:hypothetical protein